MSSLQEHEKTSHCQGIVYDGFLPTILLYVQFDGLLWHDCAHRLCFDVGEILHLQRLRNVQTNVSVQQPERSYLIQESNRFRDDHRPDLEFAQTGKQTTACSFQQPCIVSLAEAQHFPQPDESHLGERRHVFSSRDSNVALIPNDHLSRASTD